MGTAQAHICVGVASCGGELPPCIPTDEFHYPRVDSHYCFNIPGEDGAASAAAMRAFNEYMSDAPCSPQFRALCIILALTVCTDGVYMVSCQTNPIHPSLCACFFTCQSPQVDRILITPVQAVPG